MVERRVKRKTLSTSKGGVSNIREYEEQQLKLAQEESQARLRFDTQNARSTNRCVLLYLQFWLISES